MSEGSFQQGQILMITLADIQFLVETSTRSNFVAADLKIVKLFSFEKPIALIEIRHTTTQLLNVD